MSLGNKKSRTKLKQIRISKKTYWKETPIGKNISLLTVKLILMNYNHQRKYYSLDNYLKMIVAEICLEIMIIKMI